MLQAATQRGVGAKGKTSNALKDANVETVGTLHPASELATIALHEETDSTGDTDELMNWVF